MALPDYNFAASGSGLPDFRVQVVDENGVPVVLNRSEPTAAVTLVDEFAFASTETGELGELGWSFTNGTANLAGGPEDGHPGIVSRASSAVSGAIASTYPGGGGTAVSIRVDQVDEMTWIVKPATAGADFDVRFGISSDLTSATPTHGVYFERLAADTNWFGVTRTGGVETRTPTGVALAASWFKLKFRRISATSIGFTVNGGTEVVATANVPAGNATVTFGFQITPTTASARTVNVDFFALKMVPQVR